VHPEFHTDAPCKITAENEASWLFGIRIRQFMEVFHVFCGNNKYGKFKGIRFFGKMGVKKLSSRTQSTAVLIFAKSAIPRYAVWWKPCV
jgi:hypothetical protein